MLIFLICKVTSLHCLLWVCSIVIVIVIEIKVLAGSQSKVKDSILHDICVEKVERIIFYIVTVMGYFLKLSLSVTKVSFCVGDL